MNNISKLLMVTLMVVSAMIIAELVDNPAEKDRYTDRNSILGKNSLDAFMSESSSYEDRFIFTYSPRNPDSRFDCYVTYEFRENEGTVESINKEFYGNVSVENPIVLEFPRTRNSTYELETTIEDKSGINLYKGKTEISPGTEENETVIK
jgi:hypothetical protein